MVNEQGHTALKEPQIPQPKSSTVKYFRGYFHAQSRDPLDTPYVQVGAQGIFLEGLEREHEYTLPESIWNAAKDGVCRTIIRDRNTGQEKIITRVTYPFTLVGDGLASDFRKLMNDIRKRKIGSD